MTNPSRGDSGKLPLLMLCAAGLLCIAFSIRMAASWKTYHHVDPTAGVWTAAADDASHGTLYRDIESPLGYGGSRYAPLHIVLQAGLIRAGMGPVAAGYLLDFLGILLILGGLFALLRKLDVAPLTAAACSPFVLAAYCYSTTAGGIKGDLIPVGLNLWGLAAIATLGKSGRSPLPLILFSALCFTLAIAAKLTSVFGIFTAVIWLLSRKKPAPAALLFAVWLVGVAAAAAITQWASGGRALGIFKLCAAGGGGLGALLHGPHRIISDVKHNDLIFACFWLIAAAVIVAQRQWLSLPTILFVLTTLGTVAIYGSPGTNCNHLVDLQAACVLVIATGFASDISPCCWAACPIIFLVVFSAINSGRKTVGILHEDRHANMIAALDDTKQSTIDGPLLAENPVLPILLGERPFMLDSFMFRVVWRQNPQVADRFWDDLAHRRFRAVILSSSPWDPTRIDGNFGPGFSDLLLRNYDQKSIHGDLWVYLPKAQ